MIFQKCLLLLILCYLSETSESRVIGLTADEIERLESILNSVVSVNCSNCIWICELYNELFSVSMSPTMNLRHLQKAARTSFATHPNPNKMKATSQIALASSLTVTNHNKIQSGNGWSETNKFPQRVFGVSLGVTTQQDHGLDNKCAWRRRIMQTTWCVI